MGRKKKSTFSFQQTFTFQMEAIKADWKLTSENLLRRWTGVSLLTASQEAGGRWSSVRLICWRLDYSLSHSGTPCWISFQCRTYHHLRLLQMMPNFPSNTCTLGVGHHRLPSPRYGERRGRDPDLSFTGISLYNTTVILSEWTDLPLPFLTWVPIIAPVRLDMANSPFFSFLAFSAGDQTRDLAHTGQVSSQSYTLGPHSSLLFLKLVHLCIPATSLLDADWTNETMN